MSDSEAVFHIKKKTRTATELQNTPLIYLLN